MDTEETRRIDETAARAELSQDGQDGQEGRAAALEGVDLLLIPDEVEASLRAQQTGPRTERLRPMWHRVLPRPGASVLIGSRDENVRVVRLTVRSKAPGWNVRWVRFAYAVRWAPEDVGGDAATAQDVLADDELTLTLLVLPGEQRTASLEFAVELDGQTLPGDYLFEVVMTDVADETVATAPGRLRLRHRPAALLRYLPAIYNTAPPPSPGERFAPFEDRPFFERFLRGFEDVTEPTQELVANFCRYLDADTAPADFLPWLATWVALVLDDNWAIMKRRRLIQEAVELYRWRGTRRGLLRYLEIYSGLRPQINDKPFQGMRLGPATLMGREALLGDVPPHTFVVTLAVPDPRAVNEQIVRDIIEAQKPAHTAYELRIVHRAAGET